MNIFYELLVCKVDEEEGNPPKKPKNKQTKKKTDGAAKGIER